MQISFFEYIKPRVVLINDCSWMYKELVKGADFELYLETLTHYIIWINETFYGVYKEDAIKV